MVGKVLWFNVKKGFGFIRSSETKDYFVHYSKIIAPPGEFRLLEEGDQVEFEEFMAERGGESKPQAMNVKVVKGGERNEIRREEHHNDFRGHRDLAR